jgi:hypothetical protein
MVPDFLTIAEAARLIERKELSPVELVESRLDQYFRPPRSARFRTAEVRKARAANPQGELDDADFADVCLPAEAS